MILLYNEDYPKKIYEIILLKFRFIKGERREEDRKKRKNMCKLYKILLIL